MLTSTITYFWVRSFTQSVYGASTAKVYLIMSMMLSIVIIYFWSYVSVSLCRFLQYFYWQYFSSSLWCCSSSSVISGVRSLTQLVYAVVLLYISSCLWCCLLSSFISGVMSFTQSFCVLLLQFISLGLWCCLSSLISKVRSFTQSVYNAVYLHYLIRSMMLSISHLFLEFGLSLNQLMQYFYSISHQICDVVYQHHLFLELDISLSQFMQYIYTISLGLWCCLSISIIYFWR